jgi:hypothetical protein
MNVLSLRSASFLAVIGAACGASVAQTTLYNNSGSGVGLITGTATSTGVPAPAGSAWSEVQADGTGSNAIAGFSVHPAGSNAAYRFADDFPVASRYGWGLREALFFVYSSQPVGSPVASANAQIWNGVPGAPGSSVVAGDTTTNRLIGQSALSTYRVFNAGAQPQPQTPDTSRPVWSVRVDLSGIALPPGNYWLDWQLIPATPSAAIFAPPVTILGQRGKAGANAIQLRPTGAGAWLGVIDPGKPAMSVDVAQDMPFIIRGVTINLPPCESDFNGDGFVDAIDLDLFIMAFIGSDPSADINADGFVDAIDYDLFVRHFADGC